MRCEICFQLHCALSVHIGSVVRIVVRLFRAIVVNFVYFCVYAINVYLDALSGAINTATSAFTNQKTRSNS